MRLLKRLLAGAIGSFMALQCLVGGLVYAEPDDLEFNGDMNFDVVFVVDASGSMTFSDPDKLATETMNLFTDMCDEDTCRAGYVIYSHEIEDAQELLPLNNATAVSSFKSGIGGIEYLPSADTDIALGLTEAMCIQERGGGDGTRNPMIVLLSDGNTDLPKGPRTVEESQAELEQTMQQLVAMEIPVFTIGLNANGALDVAEMQRIADTTGGESYETSSADNLQDIIISIFAHFNHISDNPIDPDFEASPDDPSVGDYIAEVNIDNSSVYCANIIVRSTMGLSDPRVFTPNGYQVALDSDNIIVKESSTYYLIKLLLPEVGNWTVRLRGLSEDQVEVNYLKSYSIIVKQEFSAQRVLAGQKVKLTAVLETGEGMIDDADLLSNLAATTTYTSKLSGSSQQISLINHKDGTFSEEITLPSPGEYEFVTTIRAGDGSFEKFSKPHVIVAEDTLGTVLTHVEQVLSSNRIEAGQTVDITSQIFSELSAEYLTDTELLGGMTAVCSLIGENGIVDQEMELGDDQAFHTSYTVRDSGIYSVMTRITVPGEESVKESFPEQLTVTKMQPQVHSNANVTVRSKPLSRSAEIKVSSYAAWDSTERIQVSVLPGNAALYGVETAEETGDVRIVVHGVKSGTDTAQVTVTDSSGASCTFQMNVKVENGWIPILIGILIACLIVVIIYMIYLAARPKLRGAVLNIFVSVPPELASIAPSQQEIALPRKKHSTTLYDALHTNVNAPALQSLEKVIDQMNLTGTLRNIQITAKGGKKLGMKVIVRRDSRVVNSREITKTTEFTLGSGNGMEIMVLCGDDGELVVSY